MMARQSEFLTGMGTMPLPSPHARFFCITCGNLAESGVTQMTFSKMTDSRHVQFVCPECGWTNKLNAHRGQPVEQAAP